MSSKTKKKPPSSGGEKKTATTASAAKRNSSTVPAVASSFTAARTASEQIGSSTSPSASPRPTDAQVPPSKLLRILKDSKGKTSARSASSRFTQQTK